MAKGLMIAAPKSGSGKTTVTLGLLRAIARRGIKVGAFKCGPDYIDPAFHKLATGEESFNLDGWTMPSSVLDHNVARGIQDKEFFIAEGSMGLFDGVATVGASSDGASAYIAARYGIPVVLVIDVSGQSQSAGAIAMGFRDFDPSVNIAGVILQNVASERHRMLAARGVERVGIKVLGSIPRGGVPLIPERHLGLVQAEELPNALKLVDALSEAIEQHVDMGAILDIPSPTGGGLGWGHPRSDSKNNAPLSTTSLMGEEFKRVALASDVAFSFMYPHILADWREAGVEILPFSPLANEAPDPSADCCWLPGGYPELHAERLSNNATFLNGLRSFTKPIHGECGGYMVLGNAIIDAEGASWPMAGLLPLTTSFAKRKLHLGYRAMRLAADSPIGKAGTLVRGHEFHYASITEQGASESLGEVTDANGVALGSGGQRVGQVTGTFFHAVASGA